MSNPTRWQRYDTFIIVIAGLATIFSRWPFHFALLNNHDAVNYALALDHFDMRLHQPQPPGYPLYILVGRFFYLIWPDHRTALIWLATIFSGWGVITIYLVGRDMFNRRVGTIAVLMLATSSMFWIQGTIAAPYTTDLFVSAMVGWLCYRLVTSSGRGVVWITAIAVGLAGAFRLQTIMFLFPLFLYAVRQRSWRIIIAAAVVSGGVFALFFIPAIMISGGPVAFVNSMQNIVPVFRSSSTIVRSVNSVRYLINIKTIGQYSFRALGEFVVVLGLVGYVTRAHPLRFWRDPILLFLLFWLVPVWFVYLLVWPGNEGTILVSLPPLFVLAAVGLDWIMERPRWGMIVGSILLLILLVWNVALFTILPQYPFGEAYRRFDNHETITAVTEYYQTKFSLMREVPVEGTIVYANAYRHLQYYLPQFYTFSAPSFRRSNPEVARAIAAIKNGQLENWTEVDVTALVPPGTERIVWFDLPPEALFVDNPALVEERTENGQSIYLVSVPPHYTVRWTLEGLVIEPPR